MSTRLVATVGAVLCGVVCMAAQDLGAPQFTLGEPNNTVRLAGPEGAVPLTATVSGSEKLTLEELAAYAAMLTIADKGVVRGGPNGTAVVFDTPEFLGRSGTSGLTWRVNVKAAALPPGTTHVRQAQASLGAGAPVAFEYTLTSKPAAAVQWEVKGASPVWALSWGDAAPRRRYQVSVAAQDEPLRNVRLVQSTLRDAAGRTLSVDRLKVLDASGNAPDDVGVAPNTVESILLQFDRREWFGDYGTFEGQLRFAIDGSGTTKDVDVKVQASSTWIRVAGVLLTLAGLMLTAFAAFLRARAARTAALRPALVITEEAVRLRGQAAQICPECRGIERAIEGVQASVSEEALDEQRLLPPRVVFVTPQPAADTAAALKAHLERAANRLTAIGVLVHEGIAVVKAGRATNKEALVEELDAAAEKVQGITDARAKTTEVLAKRVFPTESALDALAGPVLSVKDADSVVRVIAAVGWLLWAVVSVAVATVWIASDADYGTATDLIGSFLWGFGVTGFGAGLQALTSSGLATNINLKLPA